MIEEAPVRFELVDINEILKTLPHRYPMLLIDRVKNAVYWTPGLTLAALAEDALRARVEGLETDRGEAFPARPAPLKGGRPLK